MTRVALTDDYFRDLRSLLARVTALEQALRATTILKRTAVADTNYAVSPTDYLVAITSLSAARTITLPLATPFGGPGAQLGQSFVIKDESGTAATHTISVVGQSGQTVDGFGVTITANYGSVRVYSTGTAYFTF